MSSDANKFPIITYYLPFKEDVVHQFNKPGSLSPNDALSQVWLKVIGPVILEKKLKMKNKVKSLKTDRLIDGRRTKSDQKSFRKLLDQTGELNTVA